MAIVAIAIVAHRYSGHESSTRGVTSQCIVLSVTMRIVTTNHNPHHNPTT